MKSQRDKVFSYVRERYGAQIERLWARYPDYAVFRHDDNKKWYGIVMRLPRERLRLSGEGEIDVLNVKIPDPLRRELLIAHEGYLPGYHMGANWLSIPLDGRYPIEQIQDEIDRSFIATAPSHRRIEPHAV